MRKRLLSPEETDVIRKQRLFVKKINRQQDFADAKKQASPAADEPSIDEETERAGKNALSSLVNDPGYQTSKRKGFGLGW